MSNRGCLVVDPYSYFPVLPTGPRFNDPKGRTMRSPILSGTGNLVVAVFGDSMSMGLGPTPHTPSNTLVQNFSMVDGGVYDYVDPPLGQARYFTNALDGTISCYLGDALRSAGASRVIMAPFGVPGVTFNNWAVVLNDSLNTTFARLKAVNLPVNAVVFIGGPNDTNVGSSEAVAQAGLTTIIGQIRAWVPAPTPIVIPLCSLFNNVQGPNVRAAQAAVVNHAAGIWQGPDSDTFPVQADGIHHTDAGLASFGSAIQASLHAIGAPF